MVCGQALRCAPQLRISVGDHSDRRSGWSGSHLRRPIIPAPKLPKHVALDRTALLTPCADYLVFRYLKRILWVLLTRICRDPSAAGDKNFTSAPVTL